MIPRGLKYGMNIEAVALSYFSPEVGKSGDDSPPFLHLHFNKYSGGGSSSGEIDPPALHNKDMACSRAYSIS
jgi:hypothetical protein